MNDDDNKKGHIDLVLADRTTRLHLSEERIDLESSDKPLRIASGGAEIVFDGKGNVTIKGKAITIDAEQDLTAKGMDVKTSAANAVEIEGAMTTVKAKAQLKLQSSGMAELAGNLVKIN